MKLTRLPLRRFLSRRAWRVLMLRARWNWLTSFGRRQCPVLPVELRPFCRHELPLQVNVADGRMEEGERDGRGVLVFPLDRSPHYWVELSVQCPRCLMIFEFVGVKKIIYHQGKAIAEPHVKPGRQEIVIPIEPLIPPKVPPRAR
jgi:hypothetical protein